MQNIDTTKTHLLTSAIKYGKDNSFTIENTSLYNKIDEIQIPISNIFYEKYRGLILNNCVKIKIPDKAMSKYIYRPKSLSYDLYGTTDLWHLLLWVNNMLSASQFNQQAITVFHPDKLNILIRIVNMEAENIYENKDNVPEINIDLDDKPTRR